MLEYLHPLGLKKNMYNFIIQEISSHLPVLTTQSKIYLGVLP